MPNVRSPSAPAEFRQAQPRSAQAQVLARVVVPLVLQPLDKVEQNHVRGHVQNAASSREPPERPGSWSQQPGLGYTPGPSGTPRMGLRGESRAGPSEAAADDE